MSWLTRKLGINYKTKLGYLKSRKNDKFREAVLRIYENGLHTVEYCCDVYEASPMDSNGRVYRIDSEENYDGFYEFHATE